MHNPILPLLFLILFKACSAYPQDISDPFSDPGSEFRISWTGGEAAEMMLDGLDELGNRGGSWLGNFFNAFSQGTIDLTLQDRNVTIAHRPASFPAHLPSSHALPLSGLLSPITSFPLPSHLPHSTPDSLYSCLPTISPSSSKSLVRHPKNKDRRIALVLRGECAFHEKVLSAQERGADAVIVADDVDREAERRGHVETDDEGRRRHDLLTMYSPEDTSDIYIPSVFISRASFLMIRDAWAASSSDKETPIPVQIVEGEGWEWPLTDMLVVLLLLPSIFTVATMLIHRFRAMRQRKLDRAPALVVLSLPERIWTSEAWEKEDGDLVETSKDAPAADPTDSPDPALADQDPDHPPTSPIAVPIPTSSSHSNTNAASTPVASGSAPTRTRQYFARDECAICLQGFQRGEAVTILPCGHIFHKEEVREWLLEWKKLVRQSCSASLRQRSTLTIDILLATQCPICRTDVTLPSTYVSPSAASSSPRPLPNLAEPPRNGLGRRFARYLPRRLRAMSPGIGGIPEGTATNPNTEPNETTALLDDGHNRV